MGPTRKTSEEQPLRGNEHPTDAKDDHKDENELLDESLDETFPASDPMASQIFE